MSVWRFDRSRYEAGLNCNRLRYLGYHYQGRGLSLKAINIPQATGTMVHDALANLLSGIDVDAAVGLMLTEYETTLIARKSKPTTEWQIPEQRAIAEALIRAWHRVRKPQFEEEYEIVQISVHNDRGNTMPYIELEDKVTLAEGIELMARADCVVQRRSDASVFGWNWKTLGWASSNFQEQHDHSFSRLTEMLAIEARLGKHIDGYIVEGLYKGRKLYNTDNASERGRLQSPLLVGWKAATDPVSYTHEYASGCAACRHYAHGVSKNNTHGKCRAADCECVSNTPWVKGYVYDPAFGIDVEDWIERLPDEVLLAQFCQTTPLVRDQTRIDRVVAQMISNERRWERDVVLAHEGHKWFEATFPQNFAHCHRFDSYPCPFVKLCFDESVEEDPLGSGLYVPREPHHSTELEDDNV